MSIAEQMGVRLAQTAYSVNIKERLDFSCALFDSEGNLIANAPHMPVHLGSMGESIKTVIRRNAAAMKPGDVYVLNDPYNGGTHLPDVTVITPVYMQKPGTDPKQAKPGSVPEFYVGSRGHHADIGGITPGSMPPFSKNVEEEGVLLDNVKLVENGRMLEGEMRRLLGAARYPARNPDQNIADLRAQVAANEKGVQELRRMVAHFGLDVVRAYMRHVQDNAEECVRRVIGVLRDGEFAYEMDNGAVIRVKITIGNERDKYSETISGGTGAGEGFDGTDTVQAHMTNSRLTDPGVLEWRYPVRIDAHEIRRGSGGGGRWHGGNGATRRVRFLEPMTAAILAGHRRIPPYGMAGGAPGDVGRN